MLIVPRVSPSFSFENDPRGSRRGRIAARRAKNRGRAVGRVNQEDIAVE
jgi:hypothetical protein